MGDLRRLLVFLRPYRLYVVLAPLLMTLEVVLDLLQPRFVQRIIDEGVLQGDAAVVWQTGGLMILAALFGLAAGGGCTHFAVRAAYRVGDDVRGAVFRKIQGLSFQNLDELGTGSLVTRLTSDVNQVQEMVVIALRGMVRMPLLLLGSVILATTLNPRLSLIFLVILPIVVLALVLIIRRTFPLYGRVQEGLDALSTVLHENLAGVRVIKAFARGAHEQERFGRANGALVERTIEAVRSGALTSPVMMLTLNGGVVATLWFGGQLVDGGAMQVGQVVAFINYLTQALNALLLFSNLLIQASRAQASARRIAALLGTEPALAFPPAGATPRVVAPRGRVTFEDVTFAYAGSDQDPELARVTFSAEPGQTVALLGATGSGKTSLVQLLTRFYDVSAGRVTIDGVDVRDITEPELRELVSIAPQEAVLFSASISENIGFGKPGASQEEIARAARVAQADDFIRARPEGYDTLVGQRGVNLSGGQKQRIALARALLRRAPLLILDDSTSAVDVATEARIQRGLDEFTKGQTRIVVAQRVSSVIHADRILVLDDGCVVGDGDHAALLETCAVYREIHESQRGALQHGSG